MPLDSLNEEKKIDYYPTQTILDFMSSDAFYRGIMGPVGSGKSTGCCMEIMDKICSQEPNKDGKRKTRFVIIRNTYRELRDTTLKTWLDWFPEEGFGKFNNQDMTHKIKFEDIEAEIMFRALDRPKDVKKLLSLELTGAWINESREIPKGVVDAVGDRVGRFPAVKDGGCTWSGVMMDTNPPDEDHWWYRLSEEENPRGWEFFRQPGGLIERDGRFDVNPDAENIENLPKDYYITRMAGKSSDYIRVYYCSQYGFVKEGKPVIPEYVDNVHCSQSTIMPVKGFPIYIGIDFGLTPAAAFCQNVHGKWQVIDELVTEDMATSKFSDLLKNKMFLDYKGFDFDIFGDPAGEQRAQTDGKTPFQILNANGIPAQKAVTNDISLRTESIRAPMMRMIDGKPGFLISPKCKMLRKALAGGYCYKRIQVAGDERFHDKPDKGKYSHIADALGYALSSAGEGKALTVKNSYDPEKRARLDFLKRKQFKTGMTRSVGKKESIKFKNLI